jgi:hypothetical protein
MENTNIEGRMLMELAATKTVLDAIIGLLKMKKEKYIGLSHEEVEMLLTMFCEEGDKE